MMLAGKGSMSNGDSSKSHQGGSGAYKNSYVILKVYESKFNRYIFS